MMKKKLEDYLHLYKDCECEYFDFIANEWVNGIFDGLIDNGTYAFFRNDKNGVPISMIRPILRPIPVITEEERIGLWELVFKRPFKGVTKFHDKKCITSEPRWVLWSGVERLGIEIDGRVWADSDLQHYKYNQHDVTRYLLSKHFDIFGLIEGGLAIDKSKIPLEKTT